MATTTMPPRHRFTTQDYELMIAAGTLSEDDRVELINGEIIDVSPIGPLHVDCVIRLTELLVPLVAGFARVSVQNPIRLPNDSQPEPDITLLRQHHYRGALPAPDDILVVIEVADSTLAYDRETKLPLYAAAGIPEAWIVDLNAGIIERHTAPGGTGYRQTLRAERGEEIASLTVPDIVIPVDEVFA